RSQKTGREAQPSCLPGETSHVHLNALVSSAAVAVHHLETVRKTEQTFRVTDEEVTAWIQTTIELLDQALLLRFVEIHHDVAAEDDVVSLRQVFGFEVVKVKVDEFFYSFLDDVAVSHLVEVSQARAVVHSCHLVFVVTGLLRSAQYGIADVA